MSSKSTAPLQVRDVSFAFASHDRPLFQHLSFAVDDGEVWALVGRNGCGKSTLLHLLATDCTPTAGSVVHHGRCVRIAQHLPHPTDVVADAFDDAAALLALQRLLAGDGDERDAVEVDGRWHLLDDVHAACADVGLPPFDIKRPLSTLSGGEQLRLMLAAGIRLQPDIWLLDEPTNHLDADGKRWLRSFLRRQRCVVVATHDVDLLQDVDVILELHDGRCSKVRGNHDVFMAERRRQREAQQHQLHDAQKQQRKVKAEVQRRRERQQQRDAAGRRQRKAGGVPKVVLDARKEAAEQHLRRTRKLDANRVGDADHRLRTAVEAVDVERALRVDLSGQHIAAGTEVVFAEHVDVVTDDGVCLLRDWSAAWTGPQRVVVTGPNGAGKSTLLRLLAGQLSPTSGHLRRGCRTALFDQHLTLPDDDGTVLQNLQAASATWSAAKCRERLADFLFYGDEVLAPASTLSGGERLHLALCCTTTREPPVQVLLLDEPTNHLDTDARERLLQVLQTWPGAWVVATHDEAFMAALTTTRRVELERPTSTATGY
mgnify:CR=1 FL=1